jgi:hypothetical protein
LVCFFLVSGNGLHPLTRAIWLFVNIFALNTTFVYFGWVAELPFVSGGEPLDPLTRFLKPILSQTSKK